MTLSEIDLVMICVRDGAQVSLVEARQLCDEIEALRVRIGSVHPRVYKLADAGKEFIVIGEHEPYYMDAYRMIRDQELKQGTWTEEDRLQFAAAQLSKKARRE